MRFVASRRHGLWAAALGAGLACFVILALISRTTWYEALRERVFDSGLSLVAGAPAHDAIAIVDIDRASLQALGPWPWGRDRLARLIELIAAAKPKALGIDILLSAQYERGVTSADGDKLLASVLGKLPAVLGVLLEPERAGKVRSLTPLLVQGNLDLSDLWHAPGFIVPSAELASQAAGLGLVALPGDRDGVVRHAPLLARAGDQIMPGFAVEIVRVASGASAIFATAAPPTLKAGDATVKLRADGLMRLLPTKAALWPARTMSAAALLAGETPADRLASSIVLLGSSAPEVGGLRPAAGGLLVPSVQLQADAAAQLMSGDAPDRMAGLRILELVAALGLSVAAALSAVMLAPVAAVAAVVAAGLAWVAGALIAMSHQRALIDPILVPAAAALSFAVASLFAAADTLRRESAIRRRFEQHLAPEVVRRIVENPALLKLEGEVREVTAFFTDIEDFTAMSEWSDPRVLVRVLDHYFDGLSRVVVEHGGMVDKIVGDGMHALFNAPLDLPEHPARAIGCARAAIEFSERFRSTGEAAALRFGRTRIGIETGTVVIGDVGGGRKLDYTAHGTAINTASRLETANKQLGSAVCIGPETVARVDHDSLRPLGQIAIRGRTVDLPVYDLWPPAWGPGDRCDYRDAMAMAGRDCAEAGKLLATLAKRWPGDEVLARLVERLADPIEARSLSVVGTGAAPSEGTLAPFRKPARLI